ncbi:MAG: hypothetical protein GY851_12565 [bacterium]|nr:hypothetical protein [bacterium]
MDMMRVWPVVVEYGVGALMLGVGVWSGLSSGYLDTKRKEDRNLLWTLVGGYVLLLAAVCAFTFWLPFLPKGGVQ